MSATSSCCLYTDEQILERIQNSKGLITIKHQVCFFASTLLDRSKLTASEAVQRVWLTVKDGIRCSLFKAFVCFFDTFLIEIALKNRF